MPVELLSAGLRTASATGMLTGGSPALANRKGSPEFTAPDGASVIAPVPEPIPAAVAV